MHISIRPVSITDAASISMLSSQLGYTMPIAETLKQIESIMKRADDIALVAMKAQVAVGWIHVFFTARLECPSYCEIGGLVVAEPYRGHGIGKMLIEEIIPWCRQKNCATLRVRSNIKRNDAHAFYRAAGFCEIKQQKVFDIAL